MDEPPTPAPLTCAPGSHESEAVAGDALVVVGDGEGQSRSKPRSRSTEWREKEEAYQQRITLLERRVLELELELGLVPQKICTEDAEVPPVSVTPVTSMTSVIPVTPATPTTPPMNSVDERVLRQLPGVLKLQRSQRGGVFKLFQQQKGGGTGVSGRYKLSYDIIGLKLSHVYSVTAPTLHSSLISCAERGMSAAVTSTGVLAVVDNGVVTPTGSVSPPTLHLHNMISGKYLALPLTPLLGSTQPVKAAVIGYGCEVVIIVDGLGRGFRAPANSLELGGVDAFTSFQIPAPDLSLGYNDCSPLGRLVIYRPSLSPQQDNASIDPRQEPNAPTFTQGWESFVLLDLATNICQTISLDIASQVAERLVDGGLSSDPSVTKARVCHVGNVVIVRTMSTINTEHFLVLECTTTSGDSSEGNTVAMSRRLCIFKTSLIRTLPMPSGKLSARDKSELIYISEPLLLTGAIAAALIPEWLAFQLERETNGSLLNTKADKGADPLCYDVINKAVVLLDTQHGIERGSRRDTMLTPLTPATASLARLGPGLYMVWCTVRGAFVVVAME